MKPQVQMIVDMIQVVANAHQIPIEEAFDIVLTWIGVQIHVEEQLGTDGIQQEAYDKLYQLFDVTMLQNEKWDWIGEAAAELGILQGLPSKEEVMAKAALSSLDMKEERVLPYAILICNTWTGRDIFALHELFGKKAIYFGTEPHLRLYRIAVLNAKLHDLPAQILFTDNAVSIDLSSENWRCANLWNPVKTSKLKQA